MSKADRRAAATARETAAQLSKLRRRAKLAVEVPIRLNFTPQTPRKAPGVKRRRWTPEEAWEALIAFTRDAGARPRAADFRNNPALPSYAKVHALFGGIPEARDLLRDANATS